MTFSQLNWLEIDQIMAQTLSNCKNIIGDQQVVNSCLQVGCNTLGIWIQDSSKKFKNCMLPERWVQRIAISSVGIVAVFFLHRWCINNFRKLEGLCQQKFNWFLKDWWVRWCTRVYVEDSHQHREVICITLQISECWLKFWAIFISLGAIDKTHRH